MTNSPQRAPKRRNTSPSPRLLPGGDWDDGWPHERAEDGSCRDCGATNREPHFRLIPKEPQ